MKNVSKKKSIRRALNADFQERLHKYDELLSRILNEYSNKKLIPPIRAFQPNGERPDDLFAWSRQETVNNYVDDIQKRSVTVMNLRAELHRILETSFWLRNGVAVEVSEDDEFLEPV